ncbi:MAG: hypothetical protein JSR46_05850 [Verrucomicrobia bacterium]|nr:hypothetical protein [Verrucomicrobiota bacterium]
MQALFFEKCTLSDSAQVCSLNKAYQNLWKRVAEAHVPYAAQYYAGKQLSDYKLLVREYTWKIEKRELNCLALMYSHPHHVAGNYLPQEFVKACKAIQNGKPETFVPEKRLKAETPQPQPPKRNNAHDFLKDCVEKDSAFRKITKSYCEEKDVKTLEIIQKCQTIPEFSQVDKTIKMTNHEIGTELNQLLIKIEKRLTASKILRGDLQI